MTWAIAFFWLLGTVVVTLWAHLSSRTSWWVGLGGCLLCSPVVGAVLVAVDIATNRDVRAG